MANAVSYRFDLSNSQSLYLSNQGLLTTVTMYIGSVGQQQQSSQGVATGQWTSLPQLYRLGGGYVATVFADQTFYLSIQGSQMQMSSGANGEGIAQQISQLEPLPMQPAEPPSASRMSPMPPMQPMTMTMGDMSMSMGEMRMGDMQLGTQTSSSSSSSSTQPSVNSSSAKRSPAPAQSSGNQQTEAQTNAQSGEAGQKRFCSQCGAAVKPQDRFCAQCGSQLA